MWTFRRATVTLVLLAGACATGGSVDPQGLDPWGGMDGGPSVEDDPAPQPPPEGEAEPPLPPEDPDASPPEPPEPPPWPADAGEPPPPPEPTEDGGASPGDAGAPPPTDTGAPLPPEDGGPPPPPPAQCRTTAGPLTWSCNGPIAGQDCVAITEPGDPNGWTDNYLCSVIPMGLRWSHAGPVSGMRCTRVYEAADPHGWDNNYLCLPTDSPYVLHWSVAGPIPGRVCHAWVEPADPHTWTDNHLCVSAADPLGPPPVDPPPSARPPRFEAVFSRRPDDNRADTTIEDRLVDMINRAIPGSRVRVAVYTFTRRRVADALIAAHQRRQVDVRVVVDGGAHLPARSVVPHLVAGLGRSRVTSCDAPGTACLGTGIMHHKTFLFSALDDGARSVVVQGSHNLTEAQLRRHNNLVIVRGDSALFAAYERTFADQRRDIVRANYYRIDDGSFATRVYFFPRTTGDTAVSIVNNVNCSAGGRIRVAMAFFTNARLAVADALAARQRQGCTVEVVAGNDEIPIGRDVLANLRAAGVQVTLYPRRAGWALHSKYLLIDARYAGSAAPRRLVFTGSHNWTGPALRSNDETLLRVDNASVYDAFLADWGRIRAAATRP